MILKRPRGGKCVEGQITEMFEIYSLRPFVSCNERNYNYLVVPKRRLYVTIVEWVSSPNNRIRFCISSNRKYL